MKKILGISILSALAGALAFTLIPHPPKSAHANTLTPPYRQYEKTVAAGAIITSDVIDTTGCDDVEIFADNSAGGSTRTLTVSFYALDGTTILWQPPAASLTTGLRWAFNISRYASAQSAPASSTIVPHMPSPRIGAVLSAAGAAAGTLAIYCR
jgi:hypothetical protein